MKFAFYVSKGLIAGMQMVEAMIKFKKISDA
jgi:hypothetical protein